MPAESPLNRPLRAYGIPVAAVGLSTACAASIQPHGHLADLAMVHLLGIVFLALRATVGVSVLASFASMLAFDFLVVSPRYAFAWTDAESVLTFVSMFVVAVTVSSLSQNLRRQEQASRAAAFRAEALYALNIELSSAREPAQLAAVTERHLAKLFGGNAKVLLQTPEGRLEAADSQRDCVLSQSAWLRREFMRQVDPGNLDTRVILDGGRSALLRDLLPEHEWPKPEDPALG